MGLPADDVEQNHGVGFDERYTNNLMTPESKEWEANFTYTPTKPGPKTITFTSGSLSKTVNVSVAK